jgi:hypothetical protein
MSKLTIFSISFLLLFYAASCQKVQLNKSPLSGTYVEMEKKTDTLVFHEEYDGQNPVFELIRGYRIADGYKLPDYFSGPYNYNISGNSISLFWFLSSGSFMSYYFENIPEENKLIIGNFFKDPENSVAEKDTLVFVKAE